MLVAAVEGEYGDHNDVALVNLIASCGPCSISSESFAPFKDKCFTIRVIMVF